MKEDRWDALFPWWINHDLGKKGCKYTRNTLEKEVHYDPEDELFIFGIGCGGGTWRNRYCPGIGTGQSTPTGQNDPHEFA
ncbi:MAG: hypothetical protein ACYTG7_10205 [Planctomycetota bacterium]